MPGDSDPHRYLWLLRHGKAAAAPAGGGGDRNRPLTDRGRRDSRALGVRMAGRGQALDLGSALPPELGICSAAARTRQTADLVAEGFGGRLPVDAYSSLYGSGPELVLQYIREVDDGVASLLVVGHNPTIEVLAWELLADDGDRPSGDRARFAAHGFPTCGLAVLALDAPSWQDIVNEGATLAGLFRPPY